MAGAIPCEIELCKEPQRGSLLEIAFCGERNTPKGAIVTSGLVVEDEEVWARLRSTSGHRRLPCRGPRSRHHAERRDSVADVVVHGKQGAAGVNGDARGTHSCGHRGSGDC